MTRIPSFLADSGVPEPAVCVVTTAAIDIHQPISSDLFSVDVPLKLGSNGTCASATSESASRSVTQAQSDSSQTLGSSTDCSTAREEPSSEPSPSPLPLPPPPQQETAEATVQDLLSSLSEDLCPSQRALDPASLARPSTAGLAQTSPELEHRVSLFNQKNQEGFTVFQIDPGEGGTGFQAGKGSQGGGSRSSCSGKPRWCPPPPQGS